MENSYTFDETMMESAQYEGAQAPEQESESLAEVLESANAENAVEAEQQESQETFKPESKALKGRMKHYEDRGYKRGRSEAEAAWAEEKKNYEARLAKYEEAELRAEAKDFAQKNNMPEDIALEYLQMKRGKTADAPEQPRDASGKFTSANEQATQDDSQARATVLMAQADAFEKMTDGNVSKDMILETFQNSADVRRKVVTGEWDFADVGKYIMNGGTTANVPRTVHSPNNGSFRNTGIAGMSDSDFAKLNERIRNGAVFDVRR